MTEKEWYDDLIQKYPRIFKKINYVECGRGWHKLLHNLCAVLDNHISNIEYRVNNPDSPGNKYYNDAFKTKEQLDSITAVQVKEKFGGLRFYVSATDEYMNGAIFMAEKMSHYICDVCGEFGTTKQIGGWYVTVCQKHYEEEVKKREERIALSGKKYLEEQDNE
jgi:hypothetical protein